MINFNLTLIEIFNKLLLQKIESGSVGFCEQIVLVASTLRNSRSHLYGYRIVIRLIRSFTLLFGHVDASSKKSDFEKLKLWESGRCI